MLLRHGLFLLCTIWLFAAGPAGAGPWPRERGQIFFSTTTSLFAGFDWQPLESEYHADFGLRDRLTLGGTIGMVTGVMDRIELFGRWHPQRMPLGLALGLSAGMRYLPYSIAPAQPFVGIDIGRGQEALGGRLWVQAGLRVIAARTGLGLETATDWTAQAGWMRGRWLAILGASQFQTPYNRTTRLRPALGIRVLNRFHLVVEGVFPPGEPLEALRLGLWSNF